LHNIDRPNAGRGKLPEDVESIPKIRRRVTSRRVMNCDALAIFSNPDIARDL